MSKKDDDRILVALRDGLAFRNKFGRAYGGNSFGYEYIEHPDGRRRHVNYVNLQRLRDAGLIEHLSDVPLDGKDIEVHYIREWTLTAAGQAAAAGMPAIPDATMFAPPKVTSPEKLEAARHRLKARKIAGALTFNDARIRDRRVKFIGNKSLIDAFASTYCGEIPEGVMTLLAPHLETFVDIDGRESLRITEDGIAATARKRRA